MSPRRRMIDPSIWDDPEVGELAPQEFKLFIGCISLVEDDERTFDGWQWIHHHGNGHQSVVYVPKGMEGE